MNTSNSAMVSNVKLNSNLIVWSTVGIISIAWGISLITLITRIVF